MSTTRSAYRKFPHVSKCLKEKFVDRRKEMKLSQTVLAERAGLTRNCVQQLECHEHLPLPSTMFRLMKALDYSQEESAKIWLEFTKAYSQDWALQQAAPQTPERRKTARSRKQNRGQPDKS